MKKTICFIMAIIVTAVSASAYAAIEETAIIGGDEISYAGRAEANTPVSVTVLDLSVDFESFMQTERPGEEVVGYAQVSADENGTYIVPLDLNGKSGYYQIFTGSKANVKPELAEIHYINIAENKAALEQLSAALKAPSGGGDREKAVAQILFEKSMALGLDKLLAEKADMSGLVNAASILYNSVGGSLPAEIKSASETLDKAIAVALLNEKTIGLFRDFEKILITGTPAAKWYDKPYMTENVKRFVSEHFKLGITDFADYEHKLIEATALGVIWGADGYGEVKTYLKENAGVLGIDADKVSDSFARSIVGKAFDSIKDIGVGDYKEETGGLSGGGGGGGRGGKSALSDRTFEPAMADDRPEPIQPAKPEFTDMNEFEWAMEAVDYLGEKNIISGKEKGIFAPQEPVLREEFVKMIVGAGSFEALYGDILFLDVKEDDWYYPYVKQAYLCGIITGISEDEFGSGMSITRQDMAVICFKTLYQKGVIELGVETEALTFHDGEEVAPYAREAVERLAELKIVRGDERRNFMPTANTNRAEAAQMIYNVCRFLETAGTDTGGM